MRKLDKLILRSFIGPFVLTFLVVVFILLMVQMLKYFDDIIGKDLGWLVLGRLLFYFAVFTTPTALPLAVLLSSLITFGNLGEHFELTAIKSAGISLIRTLRPIFFFVLILTTLAFYINNNLVPKAALEAYSLLYDIKQKKPALDLREGTFYNGIPDISIKVDKKFQNDDAALKGIVVYDHRNTDGNKNVIKADSGRMYTILQERYLKFELYNGYNYQEGAGSEQQGMAGKRNQSTETLTRSKFDKTQIVFDLSSFDMTTTDKKWFQGNRIMRNLRELEYDIDSIHREVLQHKLNYYEYKSIFFNFLTKNDSLILPLEVAVFSQQRDSLEAFKYNRKLTSDSAKILELTAQNTVPETEVKPAPIPVKPRARNKTFSRRLNRKTTNVKPLEIKSEKVIVKRQPDSTTALAKMDSVFSMPANKDVVKLAGNMARQAKTQITNINTSIDGARRELRVFLIQWHKILSSSLACIAMFLIGAPLGSIIKKGGLGVPFLVSILFFIVYYLLTMQGEKLAKQDTISVFVGVWFADFVLFVIGFIFLRQARNDARIFDADAYRVVFDKVWQWILKKRQIPSKAAA